MGLRHPVPAVTRKCIFICVYVQKFVYTWKETYKRYDPLFCTPLWLHALPSICICIYVYMSKESYTYEKRHTKETYWHFPVPQRKMERLKADLPSYMSKESYTYEKRPIKETCWHFLVPQRRQIFLDTLKVSFVGLFGHICRTSAPAIVSLYISGLFCRSLLTFLGLV